MKVSAAISKRSKPVVRVIRNSDTRSLAHNPTVMVDLPLSDYTKAIEGEEDGDDEECITASVRTLLYNTIVGVQGDLAGDPLFIACDIEAEFLRELDLNNRSRW